MVPEIGHTMMQEGFAVAVPVLVSVLGRAERRRAVRAARKKERLNRERDLTTTIVLVSGEVTILALLLFWAATADMDRSTFLQAAAILLCASVFGIGHAGIALFRSRFRGQESLGRSLREGKLPDREGVLHGLCLLDMSLGSGGVLLVVLSGDRLSGHWDEMVLMAAGLVCLPLAWKLRDAVWDIRPRKPGPRVRCPFCDARIEVDESEWTARRYVCPACNTLVEQEGPLEDERVEPLAEKVVCPRCGDEYELNPDEQHSRSFLCPTCNVRVDVPSPP